MQGVSAWELINDALTFHQNNLRKNELITLFNAAGLPKIWSDIEKANAIEKYLKRADAGESIEQIIVEFVDFRNDAAHGRPDQILGTDALRQRIDFVEAFCHAISDAVTRHIVCEQVNSHPETVIGTVAETYRGNVIVATCERGSLEVGQCLYFLRNADCRKATVESLQIDGVEKTSVEIFDEITEVGIRTSVRVKKKSQLVTVLDP